MTAQEAREKLRRLHAETLEVAVELVALYGSDALPAQHTWIAAGELAASYESFSLPGDRLSPTVARPANDDRA